MNPPRPALLVGLAALGALIAVIALQVVLPAGPTSTPIPPADAPPRVDAAAFPPKPPPVAVATPEASPPARPSLPRAVRSRGPDPSAPLGQRVTIAVMDASADLESCFLGRVTERTTVLFDVDRVGDGAESAPTRVRLVPEPDAEVVACVAERIEQLRFGPDDLATDQVWIWLPPTR